MYDYIRSSDCPFDLLMTASDLATSGGKEDMYPSVKYLKNNNSAIRFCGATGLVILKEDNPELIAAVKQSYEMLNSYTGGRASYTLRISEWLLNKWKVKL